MMKVIYSIVGIVVVGLLVVYLYAGSIVSSAVEKFGSDAVGAPVKVGFVNLSLFSGEGTIRGFEVYNPKGYKTEKALSLGEIYLSLDPASLFEDKIHIREVRITKPEVFYEGGLKDNNFKTIQKNIDTYVQQFSAKEGSTSQKTSTQTTKTAEAEKSKKLQLDLLTMEEAHMALLMRTPVGDQQGEISLPKIVMKNIGAEGEGASVADVINKFTGPFMSQVGSGATKMFSNVGSAAKEAAEGAKQKLNDKKDELLNKVKGLW